MCIYIYIFVYTPLIYVYIHTYIYIPLIYIYIYIPLIYTYIFTIDISLIYRYIYIYTSDIYIDIYHFDLSISPISPYLNGTSHFHHTWDQPPRRLMALGFDRPTAVKAFYHCALAPWSFHAKLRNGG